MKIQVIACGLIDLSILLHHIYFSDSAENFGQVDQVGQGEGNENPRGA